MHHTEKLFSAIALVAALALGGTAAEAQLTRFTIGTNPAGTTYNQIGAALAKTVQEKLDIPATARPFSGSSVYLPMLQRGEITAGLNSSLDSGLAYSGGAPYTDAMTNLRGLFAAWPLAYGYITRANDRIRTTADLKGKRVVVTYRAMVALDPLNYGILATAGLGADDVTPVTAAGVPEGIRLVQEGRADAAALALAFPALQQAHVTIPGGLHFPALGPDEDKLAELAPGSRAITLQPSPVVVGIKEPTRTASFTVFVNTGTHMAEDDAYRIVKTVHESWGELRNDYPVLRAFEAKDLAAPDNPHPYHPGAARYFKEVGLWTDAMERRQAELLAR